MKNFCGWLCGLLTLLAFMPTVHGQCYSRRSYAGYGGSYSGSYGYSNYACQAPVAYVAPTYYAPPAIQTFAYPPLAVSYNIALPNYAATGSTAYGYGHSAATGLDPAGLLNSAGRYLQLGSDAASQGFSQYNQSAAVINAGNRREMELAVRQQLAQQIMQGVTAQQNGTGQYGAGQPAAGQPAVGQPVQQPPAGQPLEQPANGQPAAGQPAAGQPQANTTPAPNDATESPANLQAVADNKCVKCHGGTRKEKNLDLRDLSLLEPAKVRKILEKIMTDDPNDKMPPVKEPPLTIEEKIAFIAGAIGPSEKSAEKAGAGVKQQPNGNGNTVNKNPVQDDTAAPARPPMQTAPMKSLPMKSVPMNPKLPDPQQPDQKEPEKKE